MDVDRLISNQGSRNDNDDDDDDADIVKVEQKLHRQVWNGLGGKTEIDR